MAAYAHLKNELMEDEKYDNPMSWLISLQYSVVKSHSSKFRLITAIISGVPMVRSFTVNTIRFFMYG